MEFNDSIVVKRADDAKPFTEGRQLMTFHCAKCNTILTDSLGVAGEVPWLNCIVCPKVTNDVVVSDTKTFGQKKEFANCIFSCLKCRVCNADVGRVVHATPLRMDALRCSFLLCKQSINCYVLDSSLMVKSTSLSFDQRPFLKNLRETKQKFQATLNRMTLVKSKVDARNAAWKKK